MSAFFLGLKQVYAAITRYLLNQETLDECLREINERAEAAWREQRRNQTQHIRYREIP